MTQTDNQPQKESSSLLGCFVRSAVAWILCLFGVIGVTYFAKNLGAPEWLVAVVYLLAAGVMFAVMKKARQ